MIGCPQGSEDIDVGCMCVVKLCVLLVSSPEERGGTLLQNIVTYRKAEEGGGMYLRNFGFYR